MFLCLQTIKSTMISDKWCDKNMNECPTAVLDSFDSHVKRFIHCVKWHRRPSRDFMVLECAFVLRWLITWDCVAAASCRDAAAFMSASCLLWQYLEIYNAWWFAYDGQHLKWYGVIQKKLFKGHFRSMWTAWSKKNFCNGIQSISILTSSKGKAI